MRTFVIRARQGTTRPERLRSQIGTKGHFEVIAHTVMNAFFIASGFRRDVEVFIVLESAQDFPKTIQFSSSESLSFAGFHEDAILSEIEKVLIAGAALQKNEKKAIAPGVCLYGFGFERTVAMLMETRKVYLLDPDGLPLEDAIPLPDNPVFVLSDHLAMPKKSLLGLKRKGADIISLGKKMLFASQCVVLIHHLLDSAKY